MVCSYSATDAGANLEFRSREGQQLARLRPKLEGSNPHVTRPSEK
jgi:hypothetical protein